MFERGYKNIQVLYNGKEVKRFANAPALFESQEIITPDDAVIHLRFMKDAVDFEVFLDGHQIDNSETSPAKIVDSLRFPVYFGIGWYVFVLIIAEFAFDGIYRHILNDPASLFNDGLILYMITSSLIVIAILAINLFTLKRGSLPLYYLALISVGLDAFYGVMSQLFASGVVSGSIIVLIVFFIGLPMLFKSVLIWSFYTSAKKYQHYIHLKAAQKQKVNEHVIDL